MGSGEFSAGRAEIWSKWIAITMEYPLGGVPGGTVVDMGEYGFATVGVAGQGGTGHNVFARHCRRKRHYHYTCISFWFHCTRFYSCAKARENLFDTLLDCALDGLSSLHEPINSELEDVLGLARDHGLRVSRRRASK